MAVTDSDRAPRRAAAARGARGFDLRRLVERARVVEIVVAALEHVAPARSGQRGDALHKTRGDRRRAGHFGGTGEDHLLGAERLREVVRGETDATLGRIEAEIAPHRPAQPGIAARLGRPSTFVQPAEHDALKRLQARFQRTENAHARALRFRPPHHAVADGRVKQLGVVGAGNREAGGGGAFDQFFQGVGQHASVVAGERRDLSVRIYAQRVDRLAMAFGQTGERMIAGF